jgi:hypothetical protein
VNEYKKALSHPHGHLVLDFKYGTSDKDKLRPNIFGTTPLPWQNAHAQSDHVTQSMISNLPIKESESQNTNHSTFEHRSDNISPESSSERQEPIPNSTTNLTVEPENSFGQGDNKRSPDPPPPPGIPVNQKPISLIKIGKGVIK